MKLSDKLLAISSITADKEFLKLHNISEEEMQEVIEEALDTAIKTIQGIETAMAN